MPVHLPSGHWKLSLSKGTRARKCSVLGACPNPASAPAGRCCRGFPALGDPGLSAPGSRCRVGVPSASSRCPAWSGNSSLVVPLSRSPAPVSAGVRGEHPRRGLSPQPRQDGALRRVPICVPGSANVFPEGPLGALSAQGPDSQMLSRAGSAHPGRCSVLGPEPRRRRREKPLHVRPPPAPAWPRRVSRAPRLLGGGTEPSRVTGKVWLRCDGAGNDTRALGGPR